MFTSPSHVSRWALRSSLLASALAVLLGLPVVGRAAETWSNGSTDFSWNNAANWSTAIPGVGDLAIFTGTAPGTVNLDAAQSVLGLSFSNTSGSDYIIAPNGAFSLTLGTSGIVATGSGANSITANVVLGASQTWSIGSTGSLTVSGDVSGGTGSGIIKAGTGTLTLSGNNSFDGGVTFNLGNLNIGSDTALGTGTLTIGGGGNLDASGGARTISNAITFSGANLVFTGTNNLTQNTGAVTLDANRTITVNGSTLEIGGIISGSGFKLTKDGAGILSLTGTNTYDGGTDINAGTLSFTAGGLGTTGSITFTGNSTLQYGSATTTDLSGRIVMTSGVVSTIDTGANIVIFASNIGSASSGSLVKTGSGSLALNGINDYTGGTSLNAGTLSFTAGGLGTTGSITFTGNSTLQYGAGTTTDLSGRIVMTNGVVSTIDTGANIVIFASNIGSASSGSLVKTGSGSLALNGINDYTGGTSLNAGTLSFTAGGLGTTGSITFTGNSTLKYGSATTTDLSARIVMTNGVVSTIDTGANIVIFASNIGSTSSGSLVKTGSGSLALNGTNNYTGGTSLNAGTLSFTAGGLGTTGSITFTGNSTLQYGAGTTTDLSGRIVMTNGVVSTIDTNGNDVVFAAAFGSSSTGALTKAGSGTLTLTGAASYTGTTTINGGTLAITTTGSIASGSALSIGSGTLTKAFTGTGNTQTFNGLTLTGGFAQITNSTAINTLALGSITRSAGGTVNFTNTGTITTSQSNTNGILGPWATVGGSQYAANNGSGVVMAYTGGTLANTAADLANTPMVNYDLADATGAVPATVSANTIRYTGSGGTTSIGTTSFTVNGLMNAGSGLWTIGYQAVNNSASNNNAITIGANQELVITGSASITIKNIIKETTPGSGLTYSGSGTLTLQGVARGGDTQYTGTTTINSGTVVLGAGDQGQAQRLSGGFTVNGGTLKLIGSANVGFNSIGVVTLAAGATLDVNGPTANGAPVIGGLSGFGNVTSSTTGVTVILKVTADQTFAGVIANGAQTIGLSKTGAATQTLTGINTYTGTTNINRGTLSVLGETGSLSSSTSVNFTNSSIFNYTGASAGSSQSLNTLTFSAGDATVRSTYGTSGNTSLTFASLAARTAGATGNFITSGGGTSNKIVLTGTTPNTFIDKGIYFGGDAYAWYASGSFVRGIDYGNDSLTATVAGPTIGGADSGKHVQITGAISGQTDITIPTLNISGVNDFTLAASQTLTVQGILKSGTAGNVTISGGTGINNGGSELVIRNNDASASNVLTISSVIAGTGGLTKSGTGTLALSGLNTYGGATVVNGGALRLVNTTTLPTISGVTSAVTLNAGGTLTFGTTGTYVIGSLNGVGSILLQDGSGNPITLEVNGSQGSVYSGQLTGSGSLKVTGLGGVNALILQDNAQGGPGASTSTFTGGTTISDGGILKLDRFNLAGLSSTPGTGTPTSGPFGTGTVTLNNGTIRLERIGAAAAQPAALGDSGEFNYASVIANALTISGGSNTIQRADNGNTNSRLTWNGAVTVTGSATLNMWDSNTSGGNGGHLAASFTNTTTLNDGVNLTLGVLLQGGSHTSTLTFGTDIATGGIALASTNSTGTPSAPYIAATITNKFGNTGVVNSLTIQGVFSAGAANQTLVISNDLTVTGTNASMTLGAIGAGANNPSFTIKGVGTTFSTSTSSNFLGRFIIDGGNLSIAIISDGGVASTLGASSNAADNLMFANGGRLIYTGSTGSTDRNFTITTGTGKIDVSTGATALTLSGASANTAGNLEKLGAGTLILTGANQHTGGTTITAGTLNFVTGALGTTGNITFNGNSTLQWAASNTSDISSRIVMTNGVTSTFDTNGNPVTFASVIGSSASGALTKVGAGTLTLTGTNTYTGITTLSAGTLVAGNQQAFGTNATATALTLNGGILDLAIDSTVNAYNTTVGGTTTINSNTATSTAGITHTLGTLSIGAFTLNIAQGANATGTTAGVTFGNVTQTGAAVFDVAANVTLTLGALQTNTHNITKQGNGLLILNSAANGARVAGTNTLTAGTMRLGSSSALGTTGATLVLNGGTLDLAIDSTVNAYNTTVGGTVTIASNKATAASAGITHTLGTLAISAQQLNITAGANVATNSAYGVTFGATTLSTGTAIFDVANNGAGVGTLTLGAVGGAFAFTKQGAGTITLATTSTRTTAAGITNLSAGRLNLDIANALNTLATAPLNISGGTLALEVTAGATYGGTATTVSGNATVESNRLTLGAGVTQILGTLSINTSQLNITAGANVNSGTAGVTFGTSTLTGNPTFDTASGTLLTLGALADGSAARTITKQGAGTMTLATLATGMTTGTPLVNINAGTLNSNLLGALGSLAAVNVQNSGATFGVGATQTIGSLTGVSGSLVPISGAFTLTVGSTNNLSSTFGGVISGASGALTKAGTGTLTLSGANTYGGATTVGTTNGADAGTLKFTGSGKISNAATTVFGGTLDLDGTTQTITTLGLGSGAAGSTAIVNIGSGGTLTLGGNVTYTSTNNPNGASITAGTLDLGATRTFTVGDSTAAATDLTVSSVISGATFGVIKDGAGTMLLSGANTYTGITTVSVGVLAFSNTNVVANANSLGQSAASAANLLLANGTTLQYVGAAGSNDRLFTINGTAAGHAATLDASGTGAINYTNIGSIAYGTTAQTRTLILAGTNTGDNTLAALIGNNGGSLVSLTKNGTGTWVISNGSNSFTGLTTVNAGTLKLGASGAITSGNAVTLTGTGAGVTATLDLASFNQTIGGAGLTLGGTTTTSAAVVTNSTGASTLTLTGAATAVTYSATNNPLGATISVTNLSLNSATQTFTVGDSTTTVGTTPDLTVSSVVQSGALTKAGLGTMLLSGANTYAGVTTVSAGVLAFNNTGTGLTTSANSLGQSSNAATNLLLANGTTLRYTGAAGSTDRLFTINGTAAGHAATLDASGTGAINFTNTGGIAYGTTAQTRTLTLAGTNTDANTFAALLTANGSGAVSVTKNGAGRWILSNASNTFAGVLTVTAGTLESGATNALGAGAVTVNGATAILDLKTFNDTVGTVTLQGGGQINSSSGILTGTSYAFESGSASAILAGAVALTKATSGTVTLTGVNTYTGITTITLGTLSVATIGDGGVAGNLGAATSAATQLVLNGGTLQYTGLTASTNRAFTINASSTIDVTTNTLTMSGNNTGAGGLTKAGNGFLELTGTSTNSGLMTVSGGTLKFSTSANLGNGSATNSLAFANNASLQFAGASLDLGVNRTVALGTGGGTIDVVGTGNQLTVSGIISGANQLTKAGLGTLFLTATNNFTGATNVTAGIVNYQNGPSFGQTSQIVLTSGATVQAQGGITGGSLGLSIAGVGAAGTTGALQNVSGNNSYAGLLALTANATISSDAGTLSLTNTGAILGSGYTLTVAGAGNVIIAGSIGTGGGGLIKNGGGNLTLNGVNTYTGPTTVSGGTLTVNGSTSGSGDIDLGSTGTLSGTGTVGGNVTMTTGGIVNFGFGGSIAGMLTATGGAWNGQGSVTGAVTSSANAFSIGAGANLTANGGLNITGTGTLAGGSSAIITNNNSINYTSSGTSTFAGNVFGSGSVTMNNAGGQLTLSGFNLYTGATNVNNGTLTLTQGVFGGGGTITLADSPTAVLETGGTITRPIVASGAGAGTLRASSNLTVGSAGTVFNFNGIVDTQNKTVTIVSAVPTPDSFTGGGIGYQTTGDFTVRSVIMNDGGTLTSGGTIFFPDTDFAFTPGSTGFMYHNGSGTVTVSGNVFGGTNNGGLWIDGSGTTNFTGIFYGEVNTLGETVNFLGSFQPGFSPSFGSAAAGGSVATKSYILDTAKQNDKKLAGSLPSMNFATAPENATGYTTFLNYQRTGTTPAAYSLTGAQTLNSDLGVAYAAQSGDTFYLLRTDGYLWPSSGANGAFGSSSVGGTLPSIGLGTNITNPTGFMGSDIVLGVGGFIRVWFGNVTPQGSGVWMNGTGTNNWSANTAVNSGWGGVAGTVPVPGATNPGPGFGKPGDAGQIATFNSSVINFAGGVVNQDVTGLVIGGFNLSAQSGNNGYTIGTGTPGGATAKTITLDNGSRNSEIAVNSGTHTINSPLTVTGAGLTLNTVGSTTTLTLNGAITASGTGNNLATGAASTFLPGTLPAGTSYYTNQLIGLSKTGNGTVALNGTNTYAGATVVSGGTLGGTGSIAGTGVTVNAGGAIRGGYAAGGNNYGTLSVTAPVTLFGGTGSTGATILTEVNRTGASIVGGNSLVAVTGIVNLGGSGPDVLGTGKSINISLLDTSPSLLSGENYTITLFTATSFTLNGSALGNVTIDSGTTTGAGSLGRANLSISNNIPYATDITGWSLYVNGGNLLLDVSTAAVPEPHHVLLICVGALLVGLAIRRRMRAAAI